MTPLKRRTAVEPARALLFAFVAWRASVIAQLTVTLATSGATTAPPSMVVGWRLVVAFAIGASLAAIGWSLRCRRVIGLSWTWCEIAAVAAVATFGWLACPVSPPPAWAAAWLALGLCVTATFVARPVRADGAEPGLVSEVVDETGLEDTVPCRGRRRRDEPRRQIPQCRHPRGELWDRRSVWWDRPQLTLESASRAAAFGFRDLPIEFVMDLGGAAPLSRDEAVVVQHAIRAQLDSARRRAAVRTVVIHADADPVIGSWELTICDDGHGLDASTPTGVRHLSADVRQALAQHHIAADVWSEPGEGCTAVLRRTRSERPGRSAGVMSAEGQPEAHGAWYGRSGT